MTTQLNPTKKLLMLSGDTDTIQGKQGPFYNTLAEFSKHFLRIDVLTPKVKAVKTPQLFENVFLHSSPSSKIFHPFFIQKKGQELHQQFQYDLFTSHDFGLLYIGWGAYSLYQKIKIPWISEIHHIPGIPRVATLRDRFDRWLLFYYIRKISSKVVGFRVVNEIQVPQALKKIGVPAEKLLVLRSAYLDLEVFQPLPTPSKRYDLVYCGRLVPNKGIFLLLEAVNLLKAKFPAIQLALIGEGPLKATLEKFAQKKQLNDHVHWLGWLPSANELAQTYNESKLMVCPSFHEGGPRVTLEALACGIPVVCTRVGIMNEILQEGEMGYFIDWTATDIAEKIAQVLNKPILTETQQQRCRQAVQHLEKKAVIEQYAKGLLQASSQ